MLEAEIARKRDREREREGKTWREITELFRYMDTLTYWSTDPLTESRSHRLDDAALDWTYRLTHWWAYGPTAGVYECKLDPLIDLRIHCLLYWLACIGWLNCTLNRWLADWLIDPRTAWLTVCLPHLQTAPWAASLIEGADHWFIEWLTEGVSDWWI